MATAVITKVPINIDAELKSLWEHTKDLPRGSIVKYEDIEQASGIQRDDRKWNKLVGKWRKRMLRERSIYIPRAITGIGFPIPAGDDQIECAKTREHRGAKLIAEAEAIAGIIATTDLSEQGVERQKRMVAHCEHVRTLRNESAAEQKKWLGTPQVLPRVRFLPNGSGSQKPK